MSNGDMVVVEQLMPPTYCQYTLPTHLLSVHSAHPPTIIYSTHPPTVSTLCPPTYCQYTLEGHQQRFGGSIIWV